MTAAGPGVLPAPATPAGRRIAVLGAPRSGRTQLAHELVEALQRLACDLQVLDAEDLAADATLLMGLDLPSARGGEAADTQLRARLQARGVAYQVVYGAGAQRLRGALRALAAAGVLPPGRVRREEEGGAARRWIAACEKCSDPACEHRLFTRLRQERQAPAGSADA